MREQRDLHGLIKALNDERSDVRRDSASALGDIGGAATMDGLVAAMRDKEAEVRYAAARALMQVCRTINDVRAIHAFVSALDDSDWKVRMAGAEALWASYPYWKQDRAPFLQSVEPLCQMLKDEDAKVRSWAAAALGVIGDPRAVDPLCATLADKDSWVRSSAARALGKIGDPSALAPLQVASQDPEPQVREYAALAVNNIEKHLKTRS